MFGKFVAETNKQKITVRSQISMMDDFTHEKTPTGSLYKEKQNAFKHVIEKWLGNEQISQIH